MSLPKEPFIPQVDSAVTKRPSVPHIVAVPTGAEPFKVERANDPNSVSCGIAISEADRRGRLKVATQRYIQRGYIQPDNPFITADGLYLDQYEPFAVPLVAKTGDEVTASMRLILNTEKLGLPIVHEPEIKIATGWQKAVSEASYEVSQLAKPDGLRDPRPTLGLFRAYIAYARSLDRPKAVAVIDDGVKQILNGHRMSFGLPAIGPGVMYMGSVSTPVFINIEDVIENCYNAGNHALSQFLDTGKAPGFEWYVGR